MKTTSVAILALISASALAQPIVVLQSNTNLNTRDIAPSDFTALEARKIHINWGKVGNVFKGAAKIGASLLFRRNEDGDVFLVARDLIDDDDELLARDFDDDYLEARDLTDLEARKIHINWGKVGKFFKGAAKIGASLLFKRNEDGDVFLVARDFIDDNGELLARDFDDNYLEARDLTDLEARKIHINWGKVGKFFKGAAKIGASLLFKRNEDGDVFLVARELIDDNGELLARDFDDNYLEARDMDDYLETRGFDDDYLEARDFDDEYLEARDFDLEERSRFSEVGRIGEHLFHHAHQVHQVASYIPQRNQNQNRRRDFVEEGGLYDLD